MLKCLAGNKRKVLGERNFLKKVSLPQTPTLQKLFIFGWLHRRTEILEAKGVHFSIMVYPAYGATSEEYLNIKKL